MAIGFRAVFQPTNDITTPLGPATLPTGTAAGDMVAILLIYKYPTSTILADPTNWQSPANNKIANTGLTAGIDSGNVQLAMYFREYDGVWTLPAIDLSANPDIALQGLVSYTKGAGEVWDPVVCGVASDNTVDATGLSVNPAAFGTTIPLAAGDWLGTLMGMNGDAGTRGVPVTTVTGVTLGAAVTRIDIGSASGQDVRSISIDQPYSSGTASAGPDTVSTYSVAGSANLAGVAGFYRLRVSTPPVGTVKRIMQARQAVMRSVTW